MPQRRWQWLTHELVLAGHEVAVITPPPLADRKIGWWQWASQPGEHSRRSIETGPSGEAIFRCGFVPVGSALTAKVANQVAVAVGMVRVALCEHHRGGIRPDLVIGTVPALPTALVTAAVASMVRVLYILDLRDAWPDLLEYSSSWNQGMGSKSLREQILSKGPLQAVSRLTTTAINGSLRGASALIVTSQRLSDSLKDRSVLQRDDAPQRLATMRNVFPVGTSPTTDSRVEGSGDSLNVLYAGTIGRAQDLINAVDAAVIASERGVDVSFRFVGTGAARSQLEEQAQDRGINATFEARRHPTDLADYYQRADTALVHLADWEPLTRTVPSKTFELMSVGIHITGVVSGETADLIEGNRAGHVVDPGSPEQLAELWARLTADRQQLAVGSEAREWVEAERDRAVEHEFLPLIQEFDLNG